MEGKGCEPITEQLLTKCKISLSREDKDNDPRLNVQPVLSGSGISSGVGRGQMDFERPSTETRNEVLSASKGATGKNLAAREDEQVVMDCTHNSITSKLEAASPYNFFLTTVTDSEQTHNEKLSISFTELLDPVLGELDEVLQLNCTVQLHWVLAQFYALGLRRIPMTILYTQMEGRVTDQLKSFITTKQIVCPTEFGSHHTKMMMFSYKDGGIRIVVSTANLEESDWDNRTQGLWISPKCPPLPEGSDTLSGESPTQFKMCLTRYLSAYEIPELVPWINKVSGADMTAIRVFFVASVPGDHCGQALKQWGLGALESVLSENLVVPDENQYPVLLQSSSVGSFGPYLDCYIGKQVLSTFCSGKRDGVVKRPDVKLIYPSLDDVDSSYDGRLGGACLLYSRTLHRKQPWLTSIMCHWRSDSRHRSRAVPHLKTYCRISPDHQKLSYFVLTSANLTKAAWGSYWKEGQVTIGSYEAGVVFLPQYFFGTEYFPLKKVEGDSTPLFPFPYDLPLRPYTFGDVPWFCENLP